MHYLIGTLPPPDYKLLEVREYIFIFPASMIVLGM